MNNIFLKTNAYWVKYGRYEYRRGDDGILYLMPAPGAEPSVYDPMKDPEPLVVDALNVGRLAMRQGVDNKTLQDAVMGFTEKYGLLGFLPALPTTPDFVNYDTVYLPKNHFVRDEMLDTHGYLSYFFPFNLPDIYKDKEQSRWDVKIQASNGKAAAVAMTYAVEPWGVGMSLLPEYAERYDWLVTQFKDWAYTLVAKFLYYEDKDKLSPETLELYREGVSAFGGKAPIYRISLYDDSARIVWDFHSLLLTVQTLFGFALTDEKRPLHICGHCNQAFIAKRPDAAFCSRKCRDRHDAGKNKARPRDETTP